MAKDFDTLARIYGNNAIMKIVETAVKEASNVITNVDNMERSIYNRIIRYVKDDYKRMGNVRYIARLVYEDIAVYKKRGSTQNYVSTTISDDEEIEPVAEVRGEYDDIEVYETIEELSKGDDRRRFILANWAEGYHNDSELAEYLALIFGGKANSQRQFIMRFRNECKARLTT